MVVIMARKRSGAHNPEHRAGRYDAAHREERSRRVAIKHLLTCPRCHKSVAGVPDGLLHLDHDDTDPTGKRYLDGLAHQLCNDRAAAHHTNAKRRQQPYTRARARAVVLSTRAPGSTLTW